MTDPEREQQLAEALADLLDRKSTAPVPAELAAEWSALAEIDRAVRPRGAAGKAVGPPDRGRNRVGRHGPRPARRGPGARPQSGHQNACRPLRR